MESNLTNNHTSQLASINYHPYWKNIPMENATDLFWHPHWRQWGPIGEVTNLITAVVMILVFILGTMGNCTVVFLFCRDKKLQTAANMYVVNLASTELIMCLVNFPILIWACLNGSWPLNNIWCQVYGVVGSITGLVSMNTLTAMAVDRYQVIYRNNCINSHASKGSHSLIITAIWIYSVVWAFIPVLGWGRYVLAGSRSSCCFDYLSRDSANIAFIICLFIFCFVIQFIIILYCYSSMLVFICRHERMFISSHFMKADRASRKKLKLELKVTKLVLVIISSFCLSWLPFSVVALIGAFGNTALITPLTSILPGVLAKTSTAINPILYAISHPKFQMSLCSSCPSSFSRRNLALSNIYHASLCKTGEHFGNQPMKL